MHGEVTPPQIWGTRWNSLTSPVQFLGVMGQLPAELPVSLLVLYLLKCLTLGLGELASPIILIYLLGVGGRRASALG